jgi:ABC-type protease/lipase transport system fused ATPase/permease subunit
LDHAGELALRASLLAARAQGCIVVLTTHRPGLLEIMDRLLELQGGRVVAPPSDTQSVDAQPCGVRMQSA